MSNSQPDLKGVYDKLETINRELGSMAISLAKLDERCNGIDSKVGMVWKLQLAILAIIVAAIVGGMWFVLQVAARVIFKG